MRFEGKVLVVTGAAGGIGRATVKRFVEDGGRVVASDLAQDKLDDLFHSMGNAVSSFACDVADEEAVKSMLAHGKETFGGIDYIFNGAGIVGKVATIENYGTDLYDQVMAVNVKGTFLMTKHAIPVLLERGGGAIVNAASTAGIQGSAGLPAYSASKHAVVGLTRSAALSHTSQNIRVNAVCPAPIDTDMIRVLEDGFAGGDMDVGRELMVQRIPIGRYGEPEEVAGLVMFLLSDEASFINGSMYAIDGGMTPF